LLGRLKVLNTKDRREESRRRKREQPHPNTSLKETRETERRDVCVPERTREGAPHKWGGEPGETTGGTETAKVLVAW
jgi:hypothetical protein